MWPDGKLLKVVISKWKGMCENTLKTKKHYPVVKHLNLCNFLSWHLCFTFYRWNTEKHVLGCEQAPNTIHHVGVLQTWVKLGVVVYLLWQCAFVPISKKNLPVTEFGLLQKYLSTESWHKLLKWLSWKIHRA